MPPKPSKDLEETLQTIIDKLATLQTQFNTNKKHYDNRYLVLQQTMETRQIALESKQDTLTNTLTSIFIALFAQHHTIPPILDLTSSIDHLSIDATTSLPPPLLNTSQANVTTPTNTTIPSPHHFFSYTSP